jgi:hypothetical protein
VGLADITGVEIGFQPHQQTNTRHPTGKPTEPMVGFLLTDGSWGRGTPRPLSELIKLSDCRQSSDKQFLMGMIKIAFLRFFP